MSGNRILILFFDFLEKILLLIAKWHEIDRKNFLEFVPVIMAEINGYFDDYGIQLNPDLIAKPGLCLTCKKDSDPDEEILWRQDLAGR